MCSIFVICDHSNTKQIYWIICSDCPSLFYYHYGHHSCCCYWWWCRCCCYYCYYYHSFYHYYYYYYYCYYYYYYYIPGWLKVRTIWIIVGCAHIFCQIHIIVYKLKHKLSGRTVLQCSLIHVYESICLHHACWHFNSNSMVTFPQWINHKHY